MKRVKKTTVNTLNINRVEVVAGGAVTVAVGDSLCVSDVSSLVKFVEGHTVSTVE